jgi:hypothetical protein
MGETHSGWGVWGERPGFDHAPAEPGTCRRSPHARQAAVDAGTEPERSGGGVRLMLNRVSY